MDEIEASEFLRALEDSDAPTAYLEFNLRVEPQDQIQALLELICQLNDRLTTITWRLHALEAKD